MHRRRATSNTRMSPCIVRPVKSLDRLLLGTAIGGAALVGLAVGSAVADHDSIPETTVTPAETSGVRVIVYINSGPAPD